MKIVFKLTTFILAFVLFLFVLPISAYADSQDVKGLNNGTSYYLSNSSNHKYLKGNNVTLSTVSLDNLSMQANYKWIIERTNNGLYVLKNGSNPNRVLSVSGNSIIISSRNNNNTDQAFTLLRCSSGQYAGTYRIKYGTRFLVRNGSSVALSQSDSSFGAYWSFEASNRGLSAMYCFNYPGDNFTSQASTVYTLSTIAGYTFSYALNKSAHNAYLNLNSFDIFLFRGHGNDSTLVFFNSSGNENGWIKAKASDINPQNSANEYAIGNLSTNSLSKARCVLYVGCLTGNSSNGNNLVNETFNKGAHFVLGFKNKIYHDQADLWTSIFYHYLSSNFIVKDCLNRANKHANVGPVYYIGDIHQRLG